MIAIHTIFLCCTYDILRRIIIVSNVVGSLNDAHFNLDSKLTKKRLANGSISIQGTQGSSTFGFQADNVDLLCPRYHLSSWNSQYLIGKHSRLSSSKQLQEWVGWRKCCCVSRETSWLHVKVWCYYLLPSIDPKPYFFYWVVLHVLQRRERIVVCMFFALDKHMLDFWKSWTYEEVNLNLSFAALSNPYIINMKKINLSYDQEQLLLWHWKWCVNTC